MTGGGVPRPVKMAKHLHRLGWSVTLLTVRATGVVDERLSVDGVAEVVRVGEWRLGRLLRLVGSTVRGARQLLERSGRGRSSAPSLLDRGFAFEEQEIEASKIGWVIPGLRGALRRHRTNPIDIAIVSLPPPSSGSIGWLLRCFCGVPYVVEYRDPWTVGAFWLTDADGRARTDLVTRARYAVTRQLEAALLRRAAGYIIVNGSANKDRLAQRFPDAVRQRPIVQIGNGIDLEDVPRPSETPASGPIRLLHTGFFYHFYTPHHLIAALRLVWRDNPSVLDEVVFEFMGDGFPEPLAEEAERWGLTGLVQRRNVGSYSESLAAISGADGLVAVLPPLSGDRDRLPTKLYEYLGTDRPILLVSDVDGAAAALLDGVPDTVVAHNADQDAIAAGLVAFIALTRKRRSEGRPPQARHRGDPHHYGTRATALDAFLRQLLAG